MQRHNLDMLSLLTGILFIAIAVVGLTDVVTIAITDLRWLGPAVLVGFGIVLIVTAGGRRTRPGADATAADADATAAGADATAADADATGDEATDTARQGEFAPAAGDREPRPER